MFRKPARVSLVVCLTAVLFVGCNKETSSSPSPNPSSGGQSSGCSYTVSDGPSGEFPGPGGEFVITITTAAGCSWSASSSAEFIAPVGAASGSGPGSVKFGVSPNAGGLRTGSVQVAGRTLTITQGAGVQQTCALTVSPTESTLDATGGDVLVTVTAASGLNCPWTAVSNAPFLSVKSGAAGSGSGAVVLSLSVNTGQPRVGLATVAGQTVTILQGSASATGCAFTVSPIQNNISASGGTLSVTVTNTAGVACAWIAMSQSPDLSVSGSSSGSGNGSVTLFVQPNGTTTPRALTALVAGQQVRIDQAAAAVGCTFAIDPASVTVPAAGATLTVSVQITAGANCAWTASSFQPWMTVLSGASGVGNGTVVISVAANTGPSRGSSVTIAGKSFVVGQDAGQTCAFSVSPTTINAPASSKTFTITVTNTQGVSCPWTATPSAPWLYLQGFPFVSGIGSSSFDVTVVRNGGAARTATLTIDGQIITINQAAQPMSPNAAVVISWQSDPGDFIGQGQPQSMAIVGPDNFDLAFDAARGEFRFFTFAPGVANVGAYFQAPSGQPLAPGFYDHAQRWPFQTPAQPGLSVNWNHRGCDPITGRFTIGQVSVDANGELQKFFATFEQHCDADSAALRGTIWFDAQGTTPSPPPASFPVVTSPTTQFSYTSEPGDAIGGGGSASFTLANAVFRPRGEPTRLEITIRPSVGTQFYFRFFAPSGVAFQTGTYSLSGNSSATAVNVFASGVGSCSSATGTLTIQEFVIGTQGDLYSLRATLDLRCGASTALFHGDIRIYADPWR